MKRQIRFRAWDIEKKCFIPDYAWALLVNNQAFGVMMIDWENYREGEYFYDNAQILMQFTGRKDINGKDIYEGDIIEEGRVLFCNESLGFFVEGEDELKKPLYDIPFTTIIGNIYETPELLKTTENE